MEDNENKKNTDVLIDEYGNKYEGEVLDGKAHGKGTKTYKDGRVFIGEFKNNKRDGYGYLIRPDGTKFEGTYKNDVQDGFGTNITKDGRKLVGFFKEGKAVQGKSIMYYNEPNIQKMHFTNYYEGSFQNNRREGYGIFIMEKEFIIGQMVINMKVSLKTIKGKEKEHLVPLMEK